MAHLSRAERDEHTWLALENAALKQEIRSLRRFLDSMQNLCDAAATPPAEDALLDLLEQVLHHAREAINARDGSLLVLDEDSGELVFVISQGDLPAERLLWRRLPPGEGIAGWVAAEGRCAIVHDARADDRFYGALDRELGFVTTSLLAAPIVGGGRVLGVVEVLNKADGLLFNADDEALLRLMCRFAGELLLNLVGDHQGRRARDAASPGATREGPARERNEA